MNPQEYGTVVVLLQQGMPSGSQLAWAIHLATASKLDLLILQRVKDRENRIEEIPLNASSATEAPALVREIREILENVSWARLGSRVERHSGASENGETHLVHVQFKQIHFNNSSSLRRLLLKELRTSRAERFTVVYQHLDEMAEIDLVKERRLFLRYIPCEVVICRMPDRWRSPSSILVPISADGHGEAALKLGQALATPVKGSVTALQVNPRVGALAEQVGERRLDHMLRKTLGPGQTDIDRRVIVDDHMPRGVRRVWDEGNHDLVVLSAPRITIERKAKPIFGKGIPVVTISAGSPLAGHFREMFEDTIGRFVPQIEREERIALVDRIQSSAAMNFDFIALMVLSTTMAAIGLIQNSGAVVIGAMLVAPLMTPLLGLGLSIEQGNLLLARVSLRSIALGLCVSLLGGFLVGSATSGFEEPTRQMFDRGVPGLLDLVVAYTAGLAAAYASCRRNLIAALPGVAIAAALVPPIATSGLALSLGEIRLAVNALLLFGINMVTIILASMTSLWLVGIRKSRQSARWVWVSGIWIIVSVLALGIYLGIQENKFELTEGIPEGLVADVRESLGTDYQLEGLAVAYDELGVQLNVNVVGNKPVQEKLATYVRNLASDHYRQAVRVRLLTHIAVDDGSKNEESGEDEL